MTIVHYGLIIVIAVSIVAIVIATLVAVIDEHERLRQEHAYRKMHARFDTDRELRILLAEEERAAKVDRICRDQLADMVRWEKENENR